MLIIYDNFYIAFSPLFHYISSKYQLCYLFQVFHLFLRSYHGKKRRSILDPVDHDAHLIRGIRAGNYRPIKTKEVTQLVTTAPLPPLKSQRLPRKRYFVRMLPFTFQCLSSAQSFYLHWITCCATSNAQINLTRDNFTPIINHTFLFYFTLIYFRGRCKKKCF